MGFDLTKQLGIGLAVISNLCLKGDLLTIFFNAFMDVLLSDISVDLFNVLPQAFITSAKKL